jgi:alkanesulfonate monooxygenase SsuD/methylene tetrahydromethanopterin reductase-like flavin-dependent oxidoreductase (luciferase family)
VDDAGRLLTEPAFSFQGRYYQFTDALNEPKGPQRPHPPICIGGQGEKRTLRTAARFAQHWNMTGGTPEEFARKRDVLYAHCADVGRDPSEITLSSHVRFDPAAGASPTADQAAALGEVGLDLAIVYLRRPLTPAVLEPLAEAFARIHLSLRMRRGATPRSD